MLCRVHELTGTAAPCYGKLDEAQAQATVGLPTDRSSAVMIAFRDVMKRKWQDRRSGQPVNSAALPHQLWVYLPHLQLPEATGTTERQHRPQQDQT